MDTNGQQVEQILEQLNSSGATMNARFTAVDHALRDVDRGVQALRDKAEVCERGRVPL